MEMRKLNKEEVKFCEKNITAMEKELEHLDFLKRYEKLMVDEGCFWNYQEKLKKHKEFLREVEGDVGINESKINDLRKQIKEGVEVKEKKIPSGIG